MVLKDIKKKVALNYFQTFSALELSPPLVLPPPPPMPSSPVSTPESEVSGLVRY